MTDIQHRIVFLGSNGIFSAIPFQALLREGYLPAGLVTMRPDRQRAPRWVQPPPGGYSLFQMAAERAIPILEVGTLKHPDAIAALRSLDPSLIVASCFPRLLPPAWLGVPPLGCLNIHPSLLPAYRGPYPLFWQFRAGETHTGVTLHFMDQGMDSGEIVAQVEVPFHGGITGPQADALTARAGAGLLMDALRDPAKIPRSPQPSERASTQPAPIQKDLTVPTTWSARRAFNFIRGANEWGPFYIQAGDGDRVLQARDALEYLQGGRLDTVAQPEGETVWVQFADGVLRVSPA